LSVFWLGSSQATRLIKEEQVDVNARDPTRDNAVPLHTAAKAGNQYMVDFLFELGKLGGSWGHCGIGSM
jgi:hypothetical protein